MRNCSVGLRAAWLFLLLCALASCATAPKDAPRTAADEPFPQLPPPQLTEFVLGPGDEVSLTVWRHPELDTTTRVSSTGYVSILPVGDVLAGGLALSEFREQLEKSIGRFYREPRIKLEVLSSRRSKVYILGEVGSPGAYPIDDTLNLVQALALAGGFTNDANRKAVVVVRGNSDDAVAFAMNFKTSMKNGDMTGNGWLLPGDIVYVAPSSVAKLDRFMDHVAKVVKPLLDIERIRVLIDPDRSTFIPL